MKPIDFEHANDMIDGEIPINYACGMALSRWKANWRERLSVLFFGTIWIAVRITSHGNSFPPMLVSGNQKFEIVEETP